MAELPQGRAAQALPARHDWPVAELQTADPSEMPFRHGRHAAQLQAARSDRLSRWHGGQTPELPQHPAAAWTKGIHARQASTAPDEVPSLRRNR